MWESLTNKGIKLAQQVVTVFVLSLLALTGITPVQALQYSELANVPQGRVLPEVTTAYSSISYQLTTYQDGKWGANVYYTSPDGTSAQITTNDPSPNTPGNFFEVKAEGKTPTGLLNPGVTTFTLRDRNGKYTMNLVIPGAPSSIPGLSSGVSDSTTPTLENPSGLNQTGPGGAWQGTVGYKTGIFQASSSPCIVVPSGCVKQNGSFPISIPNLGSAGYEMKVGGTVLSAMVIGVPNTGSGDFNVRITPENQSTFKIGEELTVNWNPIGNLNNLQINILGRGDATFLPSGGLVLVDNGVVKSGTTGVLSLSNGQMRWKIPAQYRNTTDQTFTNLAMLNNWEVNVYYVGSNFGYGVSRYFQITQEGATPETGGPLGVKILPENKVNFALGETATVTWNAPVGSNTSNLDITILGRGDATFLPSGGLVLVDNGVAKPGSGVNTVGNGQMSWTIPAQYRNTSDQTFTNLALLSDWEVNVYYTGGDNFTYGVSRPFQIGLSDASQTVITLSKVEQVTNYNGNQFSVNAIGSRFDVLKTGAKGFLLVKSSKDGSWCKTNRCAIEIQPVNVSSDNQRINDVPVQANPADGLSFAVEKSGLATSYLSLTALGGGAPGGEPGNPVITSVSASNVVDGSPSGNVRARLTINGNNFPSTGNKLFITGEGCNNCEVPGNPRNSENGGTTIIATQDQVNVKSGTYKIRLEIPGKPSVESNQFEIKKETTPPPSSGNQSLTITGGQMTSPFNKSFAATGSGNLPEGVLPSPYEVTFQATGGAAPYTWTFGTTSPGCTNTGSATGQTYLGTTLMTNTTGKFRCESRTDTGSASHTVYVQVKDATGTIYPPQSVTGYSNYLFTRYPNANNLPGSSGGSGGGTTVTISSGGQVISADGTNVRGGQPITATYSSDPNARIFLIYDNPFGGLPNSSVTLRLCNPADPTTGSGSNGTCTWTLPNGTYYGGSVDIGSTSGGSPNAGVILPIAGNCFKLSVVISGTATEGNAQSGFGTSRRFCVDVITSTSITANPGTIQQGQKSTLTWSSQGTVVNCYIDEGFNRLNTGGPSGSFEVSPTQNTTYALTCTGVPGVISHVQYVEVKVTQSSTTTPDFSIDATPSSQTVTAGSGTNYSVSVNPTNGFNSPVTLSVTGVPAGVTTNIANNPISNGSTSVSVTTASTTTPGTYTLTITGNSGSITKTKTVSLVVNSSSGNQTPDFTIQATPSTSNITPGGSSTISVNLNALNGFNGSVSVSGSASNPSITVGPNPQTLSVTSLSKQFTVIVPSSISAGNYTVTFTGTSGSISKTTTANLTIGSSSSPSINLTASPSQLTSPGNVNLSWSTSNISASTCNLEKSVSGGTFTTVNASAPVQQTNLSQSLTATTTFRLTCGTTVREVTVTVGTGTNPLSITTAGLSSGTVGVNYSQQLSATGGNGSYSWSLESGSLPAGFSNQIPNGFISGTPAAVGTSTFTVKVTSGTLTASKTFNLTITGGTSSPDFSINFSPVSQSVNQGTTANYYFSVVGSNGFNGPINLSIPGGTLGGAISVPSTVYSGGTGQVSVNTTSLSPSTSSVIISAVSGAITKSYYLTLTIQGSSSTTGSYTLSITPASGTITGGCSGNCPTYTVTLNPSNGFNSPVSLSLNAGNSGAQLSSNTISVGQNVSVTFPSIANPSSLVTYNLIVTGTSGTTSKQAQGSLTVNPQTTSQSYTLAVPSSVTVPQGSSYSNYITYTASSSNQVIFTAKNSSGTPVSCINLSPSTVSFSQQILITVSCAAGTYMITGSPSTSFAPNGYSIDVVSQASSGPSFSISGMPSSTQSVNVTSGSQIVPGLSSISTSNNTGSQIGVSVSLPSGMSTTSTNPCSFFVFCIPASSSASGHSISINVPQGYTPGFYTATISASSGGVSQNYPVSIQVTNTSGGGSGTPNFDLSVNPSSYSMQPGQVAYITVGLVNPSNLTGAVSLSSSSNSGELSRSFSAQSITSGQSSTLSISPSSFIAPGSYQVTVTGTQGTVTKNATVFITILSSVPNITSFYANDQFGNRVVTTTTNNAGASGSGTAGTFLLGWITDDTQNVCSLVNTNNNSTIISNGSYSGSTNVNVASGNSKTYRLTCTRNGASTYRDITITGQ